MSIVRCAAALATFVEPGARGALRGTAPATLLSVAGKTHGRDTGGTFTVSDVSDSAGL